MRLFNDRKWHKFRRDTVAEMKDEVSELSEGVLENSTDYLTLLFTEKYLPSKLKIHDPNPEEGDVIEKDVSSNPRRVAFREGPVYKKAQQIDVKVPYDGSRELLKIRPSTHRMSGRPEVSSIKYNQIVFHVDFLLDNGDAEKVEKDIEDQMEEIRWYAEQINQDMEGLESKLEQNARRAIESRREAVETKNEVLESIGADAGNRQTGFVKPEKARNISIPSKSNDENNGLPVLPDRIYREMLGLVDDLGINIEQSKRPVRELGEESLRDIFLTGINSHYAGLASGETFNRGGKTDIILSYENENLFVAEYKFWKGPSKYHETIDQLLDYLSVRDSQAAVIIFSRNKDFQAVKEKVSEEITNHDQYETNLTDYDNHDVYQFRQSSNVPVKIAVKTFDVSI